MKLMKQLFLISLLCVVTSSFSQVKKKKYSLKKGQNFDILLRTNNPNASEAMKTRFFTKLYPRVKELGYGEVPSGLYFQQPAIQGNYSPEYMVFGVWKDAETRAKSMKIVDKEFPDFASMRRSLWFTLFATMYQVKKDVDFEFSEDRFYVVTTYVAKDKNKFKTFVSDFERKVKNAKGKTILQLEDGKSPYISHYYEPDYFSITQWKNKEDFESFLAENIKMNHESIKYVNQFVLTPEYK